MKKTFLTRYSKNRYSASVVEVYFDPHDKINSVEDKEFYAQKEAMYLAIINSDVYSKIQLNYMLSNDLMENILKVTVRVISKEIAFSELLESTWINSSKHYMLMYKVYLNKFKLEDYLVYFIENYKAYEKVKNKDESDSYNSKYIENIKRGLKDVKNSDSEVYIENAQIKIIELENKIKYIKRELNRFYSSKYYEDRIYDPYK